MKLKLSFLLSVVALALSACAPSSDFSSFDLENSSGIINGEKITERTTKAARSVVLLEFYNGVGSTISICSGTLISERSVLTAAHCLDKTKNPNIAGFRINFTNKKNALGVSMGEKRIGTVFVGHPDYKMTKISIHNDIAIAFFSGGIPAGYNTMAYDSDIYANHGNKTVYVYGYGKTKEHGKGIVTGGAGTLHRGVIKLADNWNAAPDRYFTSPKDNKSFICSGDSGGPQFLDENGSVKVIGVVSGVVGQYSWNGKVKCISTSMAAKVGVFSPWIAEQHRLH
ncbi:S1 family peptidase [Bdellovibrio reynosensis]|uniref:Trypsin-like serine protease n=1 Tax=Bdellovibrio reynosensis TaxID=2835041 RepID=A0ABY4C8K9_9BACT|nr:trypsin-like serine protease [Bdellovibrio reynosensis]UOF01328.1 trypsin-like serine protease [Bdellovibrio reynosensis]